MHMVVAAPGVPYGYVHQITTVKPVLLVQGSIDGDMR